MSDHLPIFLCAELLTQGTAKPRIIKFQLITDVALSAFRNSLLQADWSDVRKSVDANNAYDKFIAIFKRLYHLNFPLKERRLNRKTRKPWMTPEMRHQMKTRDKLYQTFLHTRLPEDWLAFKCYRNKLTKRLRSASNSLSIHIS